MTDAFHALEEEYFLVGALLQHPEDVEEVSLVLSPDDMVDKDLRNSYHGILSLNARGETVDPLTVAHEVQDTALKEILVNAMGVPSYVRGKDYAPIIAAKARARRFKKYVDQASKYLEDGNYSDGGRKLYENLTARLTTNYAKEYHYTKTRDEMIDEMISGLGKNTGTTIDIPSPKMQNKIGPLRGGEVIGLTAYSGNGKSTLAANLFRWFGQAGVPQIVFSTEMGEQWLLRAAAANSFTSQVKAEKNIWEDGLDKSLFENALNEMRDWPFELITDSSLTVDQLLFKVKQLRRKWPGAPVLFTVDHMHRLDYGKEDANKEVGNATKAIKNMCMEDGALVALLLYQPRKPAETELLYRAAGVHAIRGDSQVWNELDYHLSPFRPWVETVPGNQTPWGSNATLLVRGLPKTIPVPKDLTQTEEAKVDDEHVYINIDKARVGGSGGTLIYGFHRPSGRVTEGHHWEDAKARDLFDRGA